ncbi:basic salivary proline-rich protein 2-like [Motacilla alba alba]|uniref:basic salivary proline-rich protein 2-like n=1 Tax=Motacilla alba alba TaxID=1094192 RepID=UPI0018D59B8D|nr:basic salivary proline-rich protein 2-like [Motacilla alba alba]
MAGPREERGRSQRRTHSRPEPPARSPCPGTAGRGWALAPRGGSGWFSPRFWKRAQDSPPRLRRRSPVTPGRVKGTPGAAAPQPQSHAGHCCGGAALAPRPGRGSPGEPPGGHARRPAEPPGRLRRGPPAAPREARGRVGSGAAPPLTGRRAGPPPPPGQLRGTRPAPPPRRRPRPRSPSRPARPPPAPGAA